MTDRQIPGQQGHLTSIKQRRLPGVRFPKVLPLVQGVLRRASLVDVRIVGVRHDCEGGRLEKLELRF